MGKAIGSRNRNSTPHKGRMTEAERRILLSFSDLTFTLEISHSKARDMLEEAGLIERHPGGPLGSRCSYYRTHEGMAVWTRLNDERMV